MKRVCITALALSVNVNAFAGACPVFASNNISATSNLNTSLNPSSPSASPFVMAAYDSTITSVGDGRFGVNLSQGTDDDVWSTGALESKLNDSSTGLRAKTLRYFGGEHTIVLNANGDFAVTDGDYTKPTTTMTRTVHSANDPNDTDFVEFLKHAQSMGVTSIHFVANVQEAFARCIPVADGSCTSYYNSNQALRNLDNFDPENPSVHYYTIAAAVQSYSVKAANWAGWVKETLDEMNSQGLNYHPIVYWDIGNEVNLSGTDYSLTKEQYNMVLQNYSYRIRNKDPNYQIGAVGPNSGSNSWWSALNPAYFDFIDIHNNYGMAALNNPTITASESTCPATGLPGKAKNETTCRTTNWPTVDKGSSLDKLAKDINDGYPGSTYPPKKIVVTEWNAPLLGDSWWLPNMVDVSDRQAMLNNAAMIGDFYSSSQLLNAMLWPTSPGPSGAVSNNTTDYRAIINRESPYGATLVQQGFVLLSPALSGAFKQYQGPAPFNSEYARDVVIWQTQAGPNRYVVIVNSRNDNVSVPITVNSEASTMYIKGISQAEPSTNCNFAVVPKVQNEFNIVVGAKSLTRLYIWH